MNKKKVKSFFLKKKISYRFPVKAADLAKKVTELHSINGAEHIYISGLSFYDSV